MKQNKTIYLLMFLVIVALVFSGCTLPTVSLKTDEAVSKDQKTDTSQKENEARPVPKNKFLEVGAPYKNEKIKSPVKVSGKSNFFEANTQIRIKDEKGKVLANFYTTAEGWMDKLYPFSALVSYAKPATTKGEVEIFSTSAQNGKEENLIAIPVIFEDQTKVKYSADFENAVNLQNFAKVKTLLASRVNYIVDASDCCGDISSAAALDQFKKYIGDAKSFNFSQDQEIVRKIRAKDTTYFDSYGILGVGDNERVLGYNMNASGKVDAIYWAVSYKMILER